MIDRALCIGINAYGNGSDLAGCVNDAQEWAVLLSQRGAQGVQLFDGDATRWNILAAMTTLVRQLGRGQTGVITYSGHGTWVPDEDGDESYHRDEALCPVDLWDNGVITDDELFEVFTSRVYGSRLVFISDSCHSGTVNRFASPLRPTGRRVRFLPPAAFLDGARLDRARALPAVRAGRSRTSALTLAGCRDDEFSYDASFDGRANGAFTRVALDELDGLPQEASYADWRRAISWKLPSQDYPQTPQLQGTASQKRWPVL